MEELSVISEQLVKREPTFADFLKKLFILILTATLGIALIYLGLVFGTWLFIFWMLAFGVIFLGVFLLMLTSVEYEYIITGNEMDIDKIVAQRKRSRLITVNTTRFSSLCRVENAEPADDEATVVLAYGVGYEDWCADIDHEKLGKIRLCFSPNRKTLNTLNATLPKRLRVDLTEIPKEASDDLPEEI